MKSLVRATRPRGPGKGAAPDLRGRGTRWLDRQTAGGGAGPPPSERKAKRAKREDGPAWIRTPLQIAFFRSRGMHRGLHAARAGGRWRPVWASAVALEQACEIDFAAVAEHVRIGVCGDGELALSDEAADLCPAASLAVEERDAAVAEVVR